MNHYKTRAHTNWLIRSSREPRMYAESTRASSSSTTRFRASIQTLSSPFVLLRSSATLKENKGRVTGLTGRKASVSLNCLSTRGSREELPSGEPQVSMRHGELHKELCFRLPYYFCQIEHKQEPCVLSAIGYEILLHGALLGHASIHCTEAQQVCSRPLDARKGRW